MALKERYQKEIVPALKKALGMTNLFQVPRLEKLVINVGLGDGAQNAKLFDLGVAELQAITGSKACYYPRQKNPLPVLKSVKGCLLAPRSHCVANGCMTLSPS